MDPIFYFIIAGFVALGLLVWHQSYRLGQLKARVDPSPAQAARAYAAPAPAPEEPASPSNLSRWLRKAAPYILFVGSGLLFIFSKVLAHEILWQIAIWKGMSTQATPVAASAATIFVDENLSGWPTIGRATGKIIMAGAFYFLASVLPFQVQRSTHPAVNLWKRKSYTTDFEGLGTEAKFEESAKVDNRATFRMAICILSAALIN